MKIFISWSGERSEVLAKALREWFPLVLHFVDPWLSQSDIQAGERWSIEIAKGLESSNFGVICVTKENLNSPWILFEAGALAKSMQDGRVIPLLLDLDFKEISGPIAQFQAKKADVTGIKELVASLNRAAASPVPDHQLDRLFPALWNDLEKQIAAIPRNPTQSKHSRSQSEILEELVSSIRNVETRVRDITDDDPGHPIARRRRRSRILPVMMHGFMQEFLDAPGDPVQMLFAASFLRDDAPWIYELALDAYRAVRSGRREEGRGAIRRFIRAFEMLQKAPFLEEMGIDRMTLKMLRSEYLDLSRLTKLTVEDDVEVTSVSPIPLKAVFKE